METRSTDTCFFPNQQITIMKKSTSLSRTLHYKLSTVIDLSFVEVKKPLVDCMPMFSALQYT